MDKVDLPGGQWVALRDADEVTERQRRPYIAARNRLMASPVGELLAADHGKTKAAEKEFEEEVRRAAGTEDWGLIDAVDDALIDALVDSWSFEVPVSPQAALDIPAKARAVLKAECAKRQQALVVDFETVTPDPASPTGPSTA